MRRLPRRNPAAENQAGKLDKRTGKALQYLELAGEAGSLGDEIGSVREDIEDARREAGLAIEGTDRASVLIGECQSIVERVRGRGTTEAAAR